MLSDRLHTFLFLLMFVVMLGKLSAAAALSRQCKACGYSKEPD